VSSSGACQRRTRVRCFSKTLDRFLKLSKQWLSVLPNQAVIVCSPIEQ
jgi:hypothetical protein